MVVLAVHRQNEVKIDEILHAELPCPQVAKLIPARSPGLQRPVIRRFADMEVVCADRIDADSMRQVGLRHHVTEHAFGGRRTANVSSADKQDAVHRKSPVYRRAQPCEPVL